MVSIGVAMHVLPLCMHSLTIAVHAECTAVMLGYHFMPLQVLQHDWCLLLNAACHSSQLVNTLCVSSISYCLSAQEFYHV